jgi:hypothetical protein
MDAHTAYGKAYEKAQSARDAGKRYIAIQSIKGGGFRLVQTDDPGQMECCCNQPIVGVWAENLTYRLAEVGYVEGGKTAVDAYFAALYKTGYVD